MMKILKFVLAAALLTMPTAASEVPWPTRTWPRSTPAREGLDAARLGKLADLIEKGRTYPDIHSVLVVRHGVLVFEKYFDGYGPDDLHMLQSVSKSFTSALIGIAVAEGAIRGVDEKVVDFFPELVGEIEHLDERKRAMTIEDLLTMRGGTDYHERGSNSPHDQLNRLGRGWDRFVLNRPMVRPPGTYFQYDSGGVILLSAVLKSRTGQHADTFAERRLFAPLGIGEARWFKNREGHPHTGGGLNLRPRDMAKLGLLYLRGGRWEDRQVVPASWVEASFREHVTFSPPRANRTIGYGYLWWILPPDPRGKGAPPIYAAMGFRGQYIFVVPEHDLVVAVTAGTHGWTDEKKPIEFLYDHILPAVSVSPGPRRTPRP